MHLSVTVSFSKGFWKELSLQKKEIPELVSSYFANGKVEKKN